MKNYFLVEMQTNTLSGDNKTVDTTPFVMCFSLPKVVTFEEIQDKVEVIVTTAKGLCESNKLYTHKDFCNFFLQVSPGVGCETKVFVDEDDLRNLLDNDNSILCGRVGIEEDIICEG